MELYSIGNKSNRVGLKEAVLNSLPPDGTLYMPLHIPKLPSSFFEHFRDHSFVSNSFEVAKALIQGAIPDNDLKKIVERTVDFPAPLVSLNDSSFVLELFHGPSLAFKDFGAKFLAGLMSYFSKDDERLVILVATSGDTGGAVASGFYNTPGVDVVILYPKGKVSDFQESQLTTQGGNIHAIALDGAFDDCQGFVKKAFKDDDLNTVIRFSSANSINIGRLIPQSFYYFEALRQLPNGAFYGKKIKVCVPSGNFGNLTAGVFAKHMGLPIHRFIAANNDNDTFYEFIQSGRFLPKPSVPTYSNAMDVGNPSNFIRLHDYYQNHFVRGDNNIDGSTWNIMRDQIRAYTFNNADTLQSMHVGNQFHGYIFEPHGAVAYRAIIEDQESFKEPDTTYIVLETAHPCKFMPVMDKVFSNKVHIPEQSKDLTSKEKVFTNLALDYASLKNWLLEKFS